MGKKESNPPPPILGKHLSGYDYVPKEITLDKVYDIWFKWKNQDKYKHNYDDIIDKIIIEISKNTEDTPRLIIKQMRLIFARFCFQLKTHLNYKIV